MMTTDFNRRCLGTALAAALAVLVAPTAFAQTPSGKPLRIIVPTPAGGAADVVARLLADGLQKELSRPVIVESKPGAGGALAVNDLMAAPRDGDTLLVGPNAMVSEIPHVVKLRIDMAKEVKPIAELARAGLIMVGHPSVPAKGLTEVIAYVKAHPGKVSYASYSAGSMSHVMGLQLNKAAGIDMLHVGYKGSAPAIVDVMGGHVPLLFDGIPNALPHLKAGKLVPYAVGLPQRSPLLPNVPTFSELGYPQLDALAWIGLWLTPDVPAATQTRLREAALKVMSQPAMRERLKEIGFDVGQPLTPEEMTKALRTDYDRVGEVLKSVNFRPE